ncbi:MAG TPA: hypothetical protein VHY21_04145 [Pseudonocardiaceae bacterium]|jgi:hypothetical protein|nr:hypothetical protein [Pseudonocardiaceae bacterium]
MGTILTSYGADADDHEGYAAQVLNDGSLTATYSDDTRPRMVGQVVAACGCGWTGTTRYTEPERYAEVAEELALAEWERDHARPLLAGLRADHWARLRAMVRELAESHASTTRTRFSGLSPGQQRELLDRTLARLGHATALAHQLRDPLDTTPGGGQLR